MRAYFWHYILLFLKSEGFTKEKKSYRYVYIEQNYNGSQHILQQLCLIEMHDC